MAGAAVQVAVGHRPRHHGDALERLGLLRSQEPEGADMIDVKIKRRCAVYTRKSSEEGLEQEFNSLHAQREACEGYIASQRSEGWVLVRDRYDDGGISAGTLDRDRAHAATADQTVCRDRVSAPVDRRTGLFRTARSELVRHGRDARAVPRPARG